VFISYHTGQRLRSGKRGKSPKTIDSVLFLIYSIIDATRIMTTNGPRGPGKLEYPHQLIFGTDPVAVDAYASTLFKKTPFDIPHIKIAHNMKLGTADLNEINIVHAETD
jgi:uncharacterized protein (DUF362 family)